LNTLVFDIETIPDTELGKRLYELGDVDDEAAAKIMFFKQKQARDTEFLPLAQHRVVVVSIVLRTRDDVHVFSLGDEGSSEREIVQRFFDGIEKYTPELVSWNGSGFDLPVLHYRALKHGVQAARYWDVGDADRDLRFNNYLSRFHWRHIDLMDVLSGYQYGGRSSLEQVALLLGYPGKLGMSGAKVWEYFLDGRWAEIRDYCETDALNTYLIFLRFQLMRGIFDKRRYDEEVELLKTKLADAGQPHFTAFLEAWQEAGHAGG
jgi:predicted PolB exonuclease-like 3'-5' exonuclease